jgi:hypothetical protein
MKLEHALICLDCNEIYKKEATTTGIAYCPVCASRNNHPIANWLAGGAKNAPPPVDNCLSNFIHS